MRNIFDMRLAAEPFEKIGREEKTVEIRLYDEKRKKIKEGDQIIFRRLSDESNGLLMNEYDEWLSQEQRDEILSIAREVFMESVWEDYV